MIKKPHPQPLSEWRGGVETELPLLIDNIFYQSLSSPFVLLSHISFSKYHIPLPSPLGEGLGVRLFLELQRNITHHIKACHWDETNLSIAVLIRMTVVVEDRAIHPSTGCIMTVEDVVEVHTEDSFLQTDNVIGRTEDIAEVDIRL